jgi:hypothetical protein
MFITTLDNVTQRRTIRPLYANTQATPHSGFLDPTWEKGTADILPGSVMTRLQGELFTLYTGAAGQKPYGLCAIFIAPKLGIDETRLTSINAIGVWHGDSQAEFEILAPAFDQAADWTPNVDGSRKLLYVTKASHASGPGLLTTTVSSDVGTDAIAELIETVSDKKIIVSLNRFA